jgi:hypothetical protein
MRKKKVKKAPLLQEIPDSDVLPKSDGDDKPYQDNVSNLEMVAIEENLKI